MMDAALHIWKTSRVPKHSLAAALVMSAVDRQDWEGAFENANALSALKRQIVEAEIVMVRDGVNFRGAQATLQASQHGPAESGT